MNKMMRSQPNEQIIYEAQKTNINETLVMHQMIKHKEI